MEAQHQQLVVKSRSLSMIGKTASAVAHSMRPLASIRASAELALTDDLAGAREVLSNLIMNAVEALNGPGGIAIRVSRGASTKRPFLELDAATIPSQREEAELFGYAQGAFTDAAERQPTKKVLITHEPQLSQRRTIRIQAHVGLCMRLPLPNFP